VVEAMETVCDRFFADVNSFCSLTLARSLSLTHSLSLSLSA
jgi:hypothetical protein